MIEESLHTYQQYWYTCMAFSVSTSTQYNPLLELHLTEQSFALQPGDVCPHLGQSLWIGRVCSPSLRNAHLSFWLPILAKCRCAVLTPAAQIIICKFRLLDKTSWCIAYFLSHVHPNCSYHMKNVLSGITVNPQVQKGDRSSSKCFAKLPHLHKHFHN